MEPSRSTRAELHGPLPSASELGAWARANLRAALGGPDVVAPRGAAWDREVATFVTLRRGGRLEGCIGSLRAVRSLRDDVARHAVAAALEDPRAAPLELADVGTLAVEVSVLSGETPIEARSREEAVAALRPGIDGVVLRWRGHVGTFLPQVWESLPDPRAFLSELCVKARLRPDFWASDVELGRYTVIKLVDPPEGER